MIYGRPLQEALPEVMERHWVGQAILATGTSLSGPGGAAEAVMGILASAGETHVSGVRKRAPRADVIRVAGTLRGRGTEALVALGGGSVIDAAKAARICLTNNVGSIEDMDRLRTVTTAASPRPCLIAIPTTLSGAAYTPFTDVLDAATGRTDRFSHKDLAPDVVLLDPAVTLATPPLLWLGSGMTALAHAIETWCSAAATPYGDACAFHGARLLIDGLPACHRDPDDIDARLRCQVGARFAAQGVATGIPAGASGLARALAALGPDQGAACIMLPHLLNSTAVVDHERHAALATIFPGRGTLADRLTDLMGELALPRRLRDAGIAQSALPTIVSMAVADEIAIGGPQSAAATDAVGALLRLAW